MNFSHTKTPLIPEGIAEGQILKVSLRKQRDPDDWETKVKGLRKKLTQEDKDKILQDFTDKILDFCESVIPNGSRRGDEWDCSDICNSELSEGDRGSCSVNLAGNGFNDQNPDANPSSGGYHLMF